MSKLCGGSLSNPLTVDAELICPVCFSPDVPMNRHRESGTSVFWKVGEHEPDNGLRYRCIICLKGKNAFGKPTECTAEKGHHMVPYPFHCEACGGTVRVKSGVLLGDCDMSWGSRHVIATAVPQIRVISDLKMPEVHAYKGMGRFNPNPKARCEVCHGKLKGKDGTSKCLACLVKELGGDDELEED